MKRLLLFSFFVTVFVIIRFGVRLYQSFHQDETAVEAAYHGTIHVNKKPEEFLLTILSREGNSFKGKLEMQNRFQNAKNLARFPVQGTCSNDTIQIQMLNSVSWKIIGGLMNRCSDAGNDMLETKVLPKTDLPNQEILANFTGKTSDGGNTFHGTYAPYDRQQGIFYFELHLRKPEQ